MYPLPKNKVSQIEVCVLSGEADLLHWNGGMEVWITTVMGAFLLSPDSSREGGEQFRVRTTVSALSEPLVNWK